MNTNEKSYIKVLKGLFDLGEEEEIKKYILSFTENDDEYDIFIQKLQEFAKIDNIEVIEEMVYDDELSIKVEYPDDYDFEDEQDYESFLFEEGEFPDDFEEIPDIKDDEDDELDISVKYLKKDIQEDIISAGEEILGKLGIEDLAK